MADSNPQRRAESIEFLDDDPFAELTRIMGHDPRDEAQAAPAVAEAPAPEPDVTGDLETELFQELDVSGFDAAPAAPDWRAPEAVEPAASAQMSSPLEDEPADFDLDLEMTGWEPAAEPAPEPEAAATRAPMGANDDAIDLDLELEMTGWDADPTTFEPEGEPARDAAVAQAPSDDRWQDATDAFDLDDDLGESLERELFAASLDEDDAPAIAAEPAVLAHAPQADVGAPADEPDFDALLEVENDDQPDAAQAVAEDRWTMPSTPAQPAPAPEAPQASSLEDELNMLLASHGFGTAVAASSAAAAPAPATAGYARANHAGTFHPTGQHEAPGLDAPVATLDDDDLVDIFGEELKLDEPQPEPVRQPAPAAPEIETLDVAEAAQVVADDLDIPDLDFGDVSTTASIYDDLDGQFAQAMDELSFDDQPATAHQAGWTAAAVARPELPAATYDEPAHEAWLQQPDAGWEQAGGAAGDPLDFDSELESAITMAAYDNEQDAPPPSARRRGLLAAGVVAAVAVVGGLGVFGMSFFGDGSDSPAVVRADTGPMKVRPENPGGTTVPNQDSEAYQRVAGGASDAAPEQRELITTTEEPVDLASRGDDEAETLAPGVSDGTDETTTALAPAMQPKSEERVAPTAEAAPESVEDLLVTPRRVRTMIVRPDGSLVAREEPAAEPTGNDDASLASAAIAAVPSLAPAGQPLPGEDAAGDQAFAADEDAGPVVDTPETVSVVPTQRREPTAAGQPARAAVQPVEQPRPVVRQPAAAAPVAATPASAPAAAAPSGAAGSAWSMQIASQPTADSAQATYQDLARRYGNVLEGRGVNIVRADIAGRGTYYRVRIPAASRDEAIQLCTRYKSAGGSCFVSR